jgi:hypothetical protein
MERPLKDYDLVPGFNFLGNLVDLVANQATSDPEDLSKTFHQIIAKAKRKFEARGRFDRYLIVNCGQYGASRYGLDVAPERIIVA